MAYGGFGKMKLYIISGCCGARKSTMKVALEIVKRLKARPAERGFTSDDIIEPHVGFNRWFRKNKGKFSMFIDNTEQKIDETAKLIEKFIVKH